VIWSFQRPTSSNDFWAGTLRATNGSRTVPLLERVSESEKSQRWYSRRWVLSRRYIPLRFQRKKGTNKCHLIVLHSEKYWVHKLCSSWNKVIHFSSKDPLRISLSLLSLPCLGISLSLSFVLREEPGILVPSPTQLGVLYSDHVNTKLLFNTCYRRTTRRGAWVCRADRKPNSPCRAWS
jgi:hypothetical protein